LATKLKSFSRHLGVKTLSFILCISSLAGILMLLIYADSGEYVFESMADLIEGRPFYESHYLSRESAYRIERVLDTAGWYSEDSTEAKETYENTIESLREMPGIRFYVKTPYRTVYNIESKPSDYFLKKQKVWYLFNNGNADVYTGYLRPAYGLGPNIPHSVEAVPADEPAEEPPPAGDYYDDEYAVDEPADEAEEMQYVEIPVYSDDQYEAYFYMTDDALSELENTFNDEVRQAGGILIAMLGLGLIALLCLIHLLLVCGRHPGCQELHIGFWDRPWLDVGLLVTCLLGFLAVNVTVSALDLYYNTQPIYTKTSVAAILAGMGVLLCALAGLWWLLSAVKRLKNRTFLRHTLIGIVFCGFFRAVRNSSRGIIRHWNVSLQMGAYAAVISGISTFIVVIPTANQAYGMAFFMMLVCVGGSAFLTAKWAARLSELEQALKKLSEGDHSVKVDEKGISFVYRMACSLNRAGQGLQKAVHNAMKSERFKTELISNVSHDLRTPLTSVITYADLLQSEGLDHPDAPRYVEVITQKAKRLKDLTDDLFEASKAASGEISAIIAPIDMMQLVSQSLGETNDRMKEAGLDVRIGGEFPFALADGKMMWRVFENLLGNILKYSMPGSRVYIDGSSNNGCVTITLRNISKDPLPPNPVAFTERFTRGDESRSDEGSGLGLAIVKSFMDLQNGQLCISCDGDLFKAAISLPGADV